MSEDRGIVDERVMRDGETLWKNKLHLFDVPFELFAPAMCWGLCRRASFRDLINEEGRSHRDGYNSLFGQERFIWKAQ